MVEITHGQAPQELSDFNTLNPNAGPADFDAKRNSALKITIKASLKRDQGGLCVYCERNNLKPEEEQIEHIKPRSKSPPDLTFKYYNLAYGCISKRSEHCGQKKIDLFLPIEPGPGCNYYFVLNLDGSIDCVGVQAVQAKKTRDILGLQFSGLVQDRGKWAKAVKTVFMQNPKDVAQFLHDQPFRYILQRLSFLLP